jgi:MYXO-CTERM domain-containing protein
VRSAALLPALAASLASVALPSASLANGRYPAAGQLAVDPADARHLVARTTFGLLQSFDAGSSWSWICEEAVSATGFMDPEIALTTGGRVILGLPDGVAIGDPSGCGWSRVAGLANDNVIDLVADRADPSTLYAAAAVTVGGAFNALVAGSTDGISWAMRGSLIPDVYPLTIEVAPSRPTRLYLGAEDGNLETGLIAVSDDGGDSWTTRASPAGVDSVYVSGVDPEDPDRLYLRAYFPKGSLYVSEDGAETWSLIHQADVPLMGFALSPDGRQIALGSMEGVTVLTRADGDAGTTYAVAKTSPLPTSCLTWTAAGLFACAEEATAGFTIGVSTDGGGTFAPLLHLADLRPAACAAGTSAAICAAEWCATATIIEASCAATTAVAVDAASGGERPAMATGTGCACDAAGGSGRPGEALALGIALALVLVRRRHLEAGWNSFGAADGLQPGRARHRELEASTPKRGGRALRDFRPVLLLSQQRPGRPGQRGRSLAFFLTRVPEE